MTDDTDSIAAARLRDLADAVEAGDVDFLTCTVGHNGTVDLIVYGMGDADDGVSVVVCDDGDN